MSEEEKRKPTLQQKGNSYYGEVEDGKPHGKGEMVYYTIDDEEELVEHTYVGDWLNGKRHGRGRDVVICYKKEDDENDEDAQSIIYNGDWVEDMRHGNGVQVCKDINGDSDDSDDGYDVHGDEEDRYREYQSYEGEWKNDCKDGYGIYKDLMHDFPLWGEVFSTYKGEFKENNRHGKGLFEVPDGYETDAELDRKGNFLGNNVCHIHYKRYNATWVNDELNGPCIYTNKEGKEFRGEMKDGQMTVTVTIE